MAAIRALELWCRSECDGYRDVAITNMTTSFRNGMAFCALIHKYRPDLIDYDSLKKEDVFENNRLAFQIAEEKLGIPALLDAEDMVALRIPDRLSILTYVSQYHNYFRGRPPGGGVKRPAEGFKEEPSKKNLPVVAKDFVLKKSIENRTPPKHPAQNPPKVPSDGAPKAVLTENRNKTGTLNSKCVSCKSHVHLVQRHFVEGRLYHRSCFKCSECSSVLHTGGYRPGKDPDSFICKSHQNDPQPSKSGPRAAPGVSSARPNGGGQKPPLPPRPSSVLSTPVSHVPKPDGTSPASSAPSSSWTDSAQKTQAARQKFFQSPAATTQTSPGKGKSTGGSAFPERLKAPPADEGRGKAGPVVGRRLAEQNRNNNNNSSKKRPFTIRSAERRFGDEPSPSEDRGLRREPCCQDPAPRLIEPRPSGPTNNPRPASRGSARPDDIRPNAGKRPVDKGEEQTQESAVSGIKGATASPDRLRSDPRLVPGNSPKPLSSPEPAPPPVTLPLFALAPPHRLQAASTNQGVKLGNQLPVYPPPRRPAVESISSAAPNNHGNPSGAKKGKYSSPTDASQTKIRSPPVKPPPVPLQQIDSELRDIETNLARLEWDGVQLEKRLRLCEEEGKGDILMDPLMVDWFNLIREKQAYVRKESELVYIARTLELERQQPGVEGELRALLEKPDHSKTGEERRREQQLMRRLVEIVDGRNAIVDGLDEDRRREFEEDQQLNEMMKNLGLKKSKTKRKSSLSKMFRRRSKRRVE